LAAAASFRGVVGVEVGVALELALSVSMVNGCHSNQVQADRVQNLLSTPPTNTTGSLTPARHDVMTELARDGRDVFVSLRYTANSSRELRPIQR
jgi:hypothetical protein